jgi:osmotically-inducible protein OsmY
MKTDAQLLADVEAELAWEPSVDHRSIVVAVKHGVVTLAGNVTSYPGKWAAEKAVKGVAGVQAIANDIEVRLGTEFHRPDHDVAEAALNALRMNMSIPASDIKIIVQDGWLTLEGKVSLWYQKNAAERAVRDLWGVKGVSNLIELKEQPKAADIKSKIQAAFQRHASLDARHVNVAVTDGSIFLTGEVNSWREREDAERAAWAAPGVTRVENSLAVHS